MKKILMIGNCYTTIVHFRRELIIELVKNGYDVWISFPNHSHGESEIGEDAANELGCKFVELKLDRRSANPLKELALIKKMFELIQSISPDCVLTYTIKPNLYGGFASIKLKIPFIVNITGLGSGINNNIVGAILTKAYVKICNKASTVFFQNGKDLDLFREKGLRKKNYILIPGSGVNLSRYCYQEYPEGDTTIFLYDARVMREKGIDEFLYAAEKFVKRDDVEFYICGDCEEDYKHVLDECSKGNIVKYYGRVNDVRPYIKKSSCVVIPTFYNEGISNCLLEAAACGRPIITTNHSGCKEVVDNGKTGFLVNIKDKEGLISALENFLKLSVLQRKEMGIASREKIRQEFDRRIVVDEYMNAIGKMVTIE